MCILTFIGYIIRYYRIQFTIKLNNLIWGVFTIIQFIIQHQSSVITIVRTMDAVMVLKYWPLGLGRTDPCERSLGVGRS